MRNQVSGLRSQELQNARIPICQSLGVLPHLTEHLHQWLGARRTADTPTPATPEFGIRNSDY
jgi:hypothetical protein